MAQKPTKSAQADAQSSDKPVTQARIAALLGVSSRTVRDYVQRGIIPESAKTAGGKLLEVAAVSAVAAHLREQAAGRTEKAATTLDDGTEIDPVAEQALLRRQQRIESETRTKLHEHKLRLARGEVIKAQAVSAALAGQISVARMRLLSLPQAIANRCPGLPNAAVIAADDVVRGILSDLASGAKRDIENEIRRQAGVEVEEDFEEEPADVAY